ncbi:MAG: HEAT repeat domain-containing protein [Gemmatales bacterium]|nr:HEAT repeat domain-containing protein [Gemmatales bacterium]MDW8386807.1 HEAT repeat domain-containing protein [Gemmatales bacterium]
MKSRMGVFGAVVLGALLASGCGEPSPAQYAAAKLPGLIKKLKDPDPEARARATDEIRALGIPYTKEALPHLFANFDDEHEKARRYAAEAVAFYREDAIPGVMEALRSASPRRRAMGFVALGTFPGEIKVKLLNETLPLLSQGLQDENLEVRRFAAAAVRFHGSLAKDTLPLQIKLLEEEKDKEVLQMILFSLCTMGTDAKDALPILNRMKTEGINDERLRNLLERAIFFVEGKDKEIEKEWAEEEQRKQQQQGSAPPKPE